MAMLTFASKQEDQAVSHHASSFEVAAPSAVCFGARDAMSGPNMACAVGMALGDRSGDCTAHG
eukprot:3471854-Rhodomonas_salina.1